MFRQSSRMTYAYRQLTAIERNQSRTLKIHQTTDIGSYFSIGHSDLNDQNLFHSTIDVHPGVPGVSKNPDNETEFYSGELEHQDSAKIEETVKNHQS